VEDNKKLIQRYKSLNHSFINHCRSRSLQGNINETSHCTFTEKRQQLFSRYSI